MRHLFFILSVLLVPTLTFAQNLKPVTKATVALADIISMLIQIAFALALLFFFWGLAQFIYALNQGEEALAAGKRKLIWGIVVIFIMTSIWGIVTSMQKIFNVSGGGVIDAPNVNLPHPDSEESPL